MDDVSRMPGSIDSAASTRASTRAPAAQPGGPVASGRRVGSRPDPASVMVVVGIFCIVLGGLVAAVAGPLELTLGSWLAAYLVLVGGVSQWAMGRARSWRPHVVRSRRWAWTQVGCWNVGNAVVVGGTLAGEPLAVALGSVLLVVALAIALGAARSGSRSGMRASTRRVLPLLDWTYRALLLALAVSIPIGIVLSLLRHS